MDNNDGQWRRSMVTVNGNGSTATGHNYGEQQWSMADGQRRRVMTNGQRPKGNSKQAMADGQWQTGNGRRAMADGQQPTGNGVRATDLMDKGHGQLATATR